MVSGSGGNLHKVIHSTVLCDIRTYYVGGCDICLILIFSKFRRAKKERKKHDFEICVLHSVRKDHFTKFQYFSHSPHEPRLNDKFPAQIYLFILLAAASPRGSSRGLASSCVSVA